MDTSTDVRSSSRRLWILILQTHSTAMSDPHAFRPFPTKSRRETARRRTKSRIQSRPERINLSLSTLRLWLRSSNVRPVNVVVRTLSYLLTTLTTMTTITTMMMTIRTAVWSVLRFLRKECGCFLRLLEMRRHHHFLRLRLRACLFASSSCWLPLPTLSTMTSPR